MNVVIYARFSSHSQTEQSIEGQLRVCYEYAKAHNYTVIGEYIDRAQSGTSDNRQSFQKMIQDSEKKTFQFVLVYQLDRFARNRYDSAIHKAKLKKNGVRVLSAKENITDDASGILIEGVLESMAEYYSVELAQKINRGMQLNAEKCLSNGSNPGLGYKVDKDRKFYIDEDEAAIVREIFSRYASGEVTADIIRDLNNRRIRTSRGKEFNKNSISRILHNKRYIGYYLYKGTETPGGMPRIIDDDLFFRVQHLIEKNKAAPGRIRGKDEYLLTTKLYCGECNTPMTGYGGTSKSGKHYHYYMCNNAKKHKCDKKAVPKEPIEDAVVDVCMSLLTEERIKFIADELYQACQDDSNLVSIKRLEAALKETENAIENLWVALEHGQSVERITKRIDAREEEKKEIEKQLAIEKRKNRAFSYPQILAYLDYMRTIGRKNPAQRSILINTFVHSVYLYDDHFTIIFNGGKGQISAENIPFKKIEKSLKSGKVGTNLCSAVVTSVPPNFTIRTIRHHGHHGWRLLRTQCKDIEDRTVIETVRSSVFFMHRNSRIFSFYLRCLSCWLHDTLFAETCRKEGDTVKKVMLLASEDMCEILRAALDDKYIILPCSDPVAGGSFLGQNPDALILDLFLPGTDGMAFLKAHAADLPPAVMAVSRFFSDELLQELEALGVSSVILIPCTLSYLRDQLAKH